MPNRQSFVQPAAFQEDEEIPLTAAALQNVETDEEKLSRNWSKGDPNARSSQAFGTAGLAAAALTLAVLVYLGVKLLVLDQ